MILHLKKTVSKPEAEALAGAFSSICFENGCMVLITPSSWKSIPEALTGLVEECFITESDIQLGSRNYRNETRTVSWNGTKIGGNSNNTVLITGPCSVESEKQIESVAQFCLKQGINTLRAGCYKPRTSPYTFQGLGKNGLLILDNIRARHNLSIITEIRDSTHASEVIEYADVIQVGAKAMYDQGILRLCGKSSKPVLIKRGFGSTLQETAQAAEFVLSAGNPNVMVCERGIRTFETKTRFTLDLCGAVWLKHYTNLPVIIDPSHAMGYAYGVPDLSRAAMALGIDGLLIETHPEPSKALSDASQQLNFTEFESLHKTLLRIAEAVGRKLI